MFVAVCYGVVAIASGPHRVLWGASWLLSGWSLKEMSPCLRRYSASDQLPSLEDRKLLGELMHKAFISVAGEDIAKAREVASQFAANQIYLYDESGEYGADMWQEESEALRASTVLLIFWSKSYLKKKRNTAGN